MHQESIAVLVYNLGIDPNPLVITPAKLSEVFQRKLEELFPLNRSLAGEDNRKTLAALREFADIKIIEIPSGTQVYDWTVPYEWELREAYIDDASGRRIIDSGQSPLQVVSYSEKCDEILEFESLKDHLHRHPSIENAIPYRTSYYTRGWGFCVTKAQMDQLRSAQGPLRVVIDSEFKKGSMSYGEVLIRGKSSDEILLSTYICHPGMANDSLSGVILTASLARYLASNQDLHYTYRIIFVPETIGALTYLKMNEVQMESIKCGLQITTVGGPGDFQIKQSWDPTHPLNQVIVDVLNSSHKSFTTLPFDIHGSDERQYSSPGFRINMSTIAKDIYYSYPEYHSSLDNLDFVNGKQIAESYLLYKEILDSLDRRRIFVRTEPHGEPMLSRHSLYDFVGGSILPDKSVTQIDFVLWVLFLCDGVKSLSDIARQFEVSEEKVLPIFEMLVDRNLLREI